MSSLISNLHERRLFTKDQRQYIYDRAEGKCQSCNSELGTEWQADHIDRHTDGGETSVTNAQALCCSCHTEKTRHENLLDHAIRPTLSNLTPRDWQVEALKTIEDIRINDPQRNHFAISATPGSGKSLFMELVARHYLHIGLVDSVLCVVPTDALRTDAATNFQRDIGIKLVSNAGPLRVQDVNGAIGQSVTYQQLNNADNLDTVIDYWTRDGKKLLVIADEIHHAADHADSSWGDSLNYALERCTYALLLSGTLWRTDETRIPGIKYIPDADQQLIAEPDYVLTLKEATETGYVTTVWFDRLDVSVEFQPVKSELRHFDAELGDIVTASIRDVEGNPADILLRYIVKNPHLEGVKKLLAEAHRNLVQMKIRHSNNYNSAEKGSPAPPAGLVVAADQKTANAIACIIRDITGEKPVIVHGKVNGDCKERIRKFKNNPKKDWIVSVGMISEGVDIPRVKVIAYLTNKKTRLLFSQIVGRAQRVRYDSDGNVVQEQAKVLMPAHPELDLFAEEFIESQSCIALDGDVIVSPDEDESKPENRELDEIIQEIQEEEQRLKEVQRANVLSTYVTNTDTVVDGVKVVSDVFFQLMADYNIDMNTAKALHLKATQMGVLVQ